MSIVLIEARELQYIVQFGYYSFFLDSHELLLPLLLFSVEGSRDRQILIFVFLLKLLVSFFLDNLMFPYSWIL